MFGTIGIEAVQPQVVAYFVDLYPEALRFESVLNGNVPMPENWKEDLFHGDSETEITFDLAK